MSSKQTDNLGLHAWERTDAFMMDEFNENFDKIDRAVGELTAALHGQVQFFAGEYIGDGTRFTSDNPKRLEFPFKPLLVIVNDPTLYTTGGFLWVRGNSQGWVHYNSPSFFTVVLHWEDRAVTWYCSTQSGLDYHLNVSDKTYQYYAFGLLE